MIEIKDEFGDIIDKGFEEVPFETLKGLVLKSIEVDQDTDYILFETDCGKRFLMYHIQSCCECVTIDDICGDLNDLLNSPVLIADEVSNSEQFEGRPDALSWEYESFTWTFYKIDTCKGGVTIRWFGSSNGYYSEKVTFSKCQVN
jgi:hypothetical protein